MNLIVRHKQVRNKEGRVVKFMSYILFLKLYQMIKCDYRDTGAQIASAIDTANIPPCLLLHFPDEAVEADRILRTGSESLETPEQSRLLQVAYFTHELRMQNFAYSNVVLKPLRS